MPNKEKKVVILIVEGQSDENAIGSILKGFFHSSEVQIHVTHGDLTSRDSVEYDTIIDEINQCIESVEQKYRYTDEDIVQVIHLIDTDGAFISEDKVLKANVEKTRYYTDHIETPNELSIKQRNSKKSKLLQKLYLTGKIKEKKIGYRIYYMSCNLEHVLYNELRDFTVKEKIERSDDFADAYEDNLDEFIAFISDESFAVPGQYKKTWEYIQKDSNSLMRHTNLNLVFEK